MGKTKPEKPKPSVAIEGQPVDRLNIWDPDFGWILKDGRPTENTQAYWAAMRKKLKQ